MRVPDARVVTRRGLLHDLDTPADLESARRHPLGEWIDGSSPTAWLPPADAT